MQGRKIRRWNMSSFIKCAGDDYDVLLNQKYRSLSSSLTSDKRFRESLPASL